MDFKKEVIERSFNVPVIVDFWAPWCGPCQYLGPAIEELAEEAGGKWQLVKVNVDENQEISTEYGIRGIPDVRLFSNGKEIAKFTGALPKPQIASWLEEHLPDERKNQLDDILNGFANDKDNALKKLEEFVENNPDLPEGAVNLAEHLVFTKPEKALALIEPYTGQVKYLDRVENVKALARLMNCSAEGSPSLTEKLDMAKKAMKKANFDEALQFLIETVMIDKSYCEELPRQATIAVFHYLGQNHELTKKYRRRFDMALY